MEDNNPDLDTLYAPPGDLVLRAMTRHLTDFHIDYLKVAMFFCLATGRESGLDVSPRGGAAGFVKALDRKTIAFADWPGNNRIESMRNLVADDRVALLFIFPGLDIFMRINGRARISIDPPLLDRLLEGQRRPKSAIVVSVEEALFHCGKAISRAGLWLDSSRIDRRSLPGTGAMMKVLADIDDLDPDAFDQLYDDALKNDLY